MIIWLASYPKSGNTWLRAFISSYLYLDSKYFDYNINIVDIVYMVEHVIDINNLTNDHQLLIADINQDEIGLVSDSIIKVLNNFKNDPERKKETWSEVKSKRE